MSILAKVGLRLIILGVLVFGFVAFARPANAFDCRSDCVNQHTQCSWDCGGLPYPPDEGCAEYCFENYQFCLGNCP
jgi:hypothetical protein